MGLNFGIDFAGGTVIEVRSHRSPADLGKIRTDLSALNLGEVRSGLPVKPRTC